MRSAEGKRIERKRKEGLRRLARKRPDFVSSEESTETFEKKKAEREG